MTRSALFRCLSRQVTQASKCSQSPRFFSSTMTEDLPVAKYGGRHTVSMIPGDGIGPEMMIYVEEVFRVAKVPVEFEQVRFNKDFSSEADLNSAVLSIRRNGVCLKGSLEKSRGYFTTSLNAKLRAELDLHTNVLHCKTVQGVPSRHNLDIVIIRQNTEGEYAMLEHEAVPGVVENTKIITRAACERLAHYAFRYALQHDRKKVTCVHKANIMKMSDGLFLETISKVAEQYPEIQCDGMIVDNTSMQVAMKPSQFDVMVTPNLYGLVLQNLVCGLAGGAGLFSGSNFSDKFAVFEPGTRNSGSFLGSNVGNPVAMLKASVDMLRHLMLDSHASLIDGALMTTLEEDKVFTQDLGGNATTREVVQNVIERVQKSLQTSD